MVNWIREYESKHQWLLVPAAAILRGALYGIIFMAIYATIISYLTMQI